MFKRLRLYTSVRMHPDAVKRACHPVDAADLCMLYILYIYSLSSASLQSEVLRSCRVPCCMGPVLRDAI